MTVEKTKGAVLFHLKKKQKNKTFSFSSPIYHLDILLTDNFHSIFSSVDARLSTRVIRTVYLGEIPLDTTAGNERKKTCQSKMISSNHHSNKSFASEGLYSNSVKKHMNQIVNEC